MMDGKDKRERGQENYVEKDICVDRERETRVILLRWTSGIHVRRQIRFEGLHGGICGKQAEKTREKR